MFPNAHSSSSPPGVQVEEMLDGIGHGYYRMIWINVYHNAQPDWSTNHTYNRQFLSGLVSEIHSQAPQAIIGIYASNNSWGLIMGNYTAYNGIPLWYSHNDYNPSFSDFKMFGGWIKPTMKMYMLDSLRCNLKCKMNYL